MSISLKCENCVSYPDCGGNSNGCGGPHVPYRFSYPIIPSKKSSERTYDYYGNKDYSDIGLYVGRMEGYIEISGRMVRGRLFT